MHSYCCRLCHAVPLSTAHAWLAHKGLGRGALRKLRSEVDVRRQCSSLNGLSGGARSAFCLPRHDRVVRRLVPGKSAVPSALLPCVLCCANMLHTHIFKTPSEEFKCDAKPCYHCQCFAIWQKLPDFVYSSLYFCTFASTQFSKIIVMPLLHSLF